MPNKIKFKRYFSKQIQLFGVFWRCIFCSRDTDKPDGHWDRLKNGRNARKYRHNPDKTVRSFIAAKGRSGAEPGTAPAVRRTRRTKQAGNKAHIFPKIRRKQGAHLSKINV